MLAGGRGTASSSVPRPPQDLKKQELMPSHKITKRGGRGRPKDTVVTSNIRAENDEAAVLLTRKNNDALWLNHLRPVKLHRHCSIPIDLGSKRKPYMWHITLLLLSAAATATATTTSATSAASAVASRNDFQLPTIHVRGYSRTLEKHVDEGSGYGENVDIEEEDFLTELMTVTTFCAFAVVVSMVAFTILYWSVREDMLMKRYISEGVIVRADVTSHEFARQAVRHNLGGPGRCGALGATAADAASDVNDQVERRGGGGGGKGGGIVAESSSYRIQLQHQPPDEKEYITLAEYNRHLPNHEDYTVRVMKQFRTREGDRIRVNSVALHHIPSKIMLPLLFESSSEAENQQQQAAHQQQQYGGGGGVRRQFSSYASFKSMPEQVGPPLTPSKSSRQIIRLASSAMQEQCGAGVIVGAPAPATPSKSPRQILRLASSAVEEQGGAGGPVGVGGPVAVTPSKSPRQILRLASSAMESEQLQNPHINNSVVVFNYALDVYVLPEHPLSGYPKNAVERKCDVSYRLPTIGLVAFLLSISFFFIILAIGVVSNMTSLIGRKIGWFFVGMFGTLVCFQIPFLYFFCDKLFVRALEAEYLESGELVSPLPETEGRGGGDWEEDGYGVEVNDNSTISTFVSRDSFIVF